MKLQDLLNTINTVCTIVVKHSSTTAASVSDDPYTMNIWHLDCCWRRNLEYKRLTYTKREKLWYNARIICEVGFKVTVHYKIWFNMYSTKELYSKKRKISVELTKGAACGKSGIKNWQSRTQMLNWWFYMRVCTRRNLIN